MRTLLPLLKTKLFLLGFVSTCTIVLATTVPQIKNFIAPDKVLDEKITTEQRKNTPKIKSQNKTISASRVTSGLNFNIGMNNSFDATVQTDKADYVPGEYVIITGSGWQAGETVALNIISDCGCTNETFYAIADGNGAIYNGDFLIMEWHLGATFYLTAIGWSSGLEAFTIFTDASSITPTGANISADKAQNAAVPAYTTLPSIVIREANGGGGQNDFTTGLESLVLTAPSGWLFNNSGATASDNGDDVTTYGTVGIIYTSNTITIPVDVGSTDDNDDITISGVSIISTDGSVLPKSGNITLTYSGANSIEGVAQGASLGTITQTHGALNNLLIQSTSNTNIPNQTEAVPFNIKITALDQFGHTVISYNAGGGGANSTAVTISSNAILTAGTTSSNFSDGVLANHSVTISPAFTGATLTATASATYGSKTGTSNSFDVLAVQRISAVNVGTQSGAAECGVASSVTFAVISTRASNGTVNGTYSVTDLPAGATYSTSPTTFTANGNEDIPGTTVTVNTPTGLTTGSYPFTVVLTNGAEVDNGAATLVVTDNAAPVITGVGGTTLTLGCNPGAGVIDGALGTATATDACTTPTVSSSDGPLQSNNCGRSQTRTFTATDAVGKTATVARTVTWTYDATPPAFTGTYDDVTLGCNPADPLASLGTATATDACGTITNIQSSDGTIVSDGCNRSITRTFTATDGCTNTATITRTVRWIDDLVPPVFTGSYSDVGLGCNPASSDISTALSPATAIDACSVPTITFNDGPVLSNGCHREQTRTFTAEDDCGNEFTVSRKVTWIHDATPPVFTGSYSDVGLGCNPASSDITTALSPATASDACSVPTITFNDGPVLSNGCHREQTRTFTAEDGCGNESSASRKVTWIHDITPPVFTGSYIDVGLGCNPASSDITAALSPATASDACSVPTITFNDGPVLSNGCHREQTRTFTAEDDCGNEFTVSRRVNWIHDVTPPVFTGSYSTVPLACNPKASDISAALDGATATDACGALTITPSDGSVQSDGCIRSQTRTFTAKDACNNISTLSRTVTWTEDVTAPTFTGTYTTVDLDCNPTSSAITAALDGATATDACSTPTITFKDGTVITSGCVRTQVRTFTAKDACNNARTISRTVTWIVDLTPPVFTGTYSPVDLDCNPTSSAITAALDGATASDACGPLTITPSDGAVVTTGCGRSQTRTFTAEDHCGNTSTTSRTVTWIVDITPPTFTGIYTTVNLDCNPTASAITAALDGATASDACGPLTITPSDGTVVTTGCGRSQTRTFTAEDHCGNTTTTSRTVTWIVDITPPVFTGTYSSVPLACNPKATDISAALDGATATDVCGALTITPSDGTVQSDGCIRSQTRTFTAKDHCANTSTVSRTVTWTEDVTAPTFTGTYTTVDLDCNPTSSAITAALDGATATDACSTPTITFKDGTVITSGCVRTQVRTFTAKDACNNARTISRTVTWIVDLTPPVFTGTYSPVDLDCNPTSSAITAALDGATASDACGPLTITPSDGAVVTTGCGRSQTRTFTAEDHCGNTSTTSRTVTWIVDITPPTFTGIYTTVNLDCNPTASAITAALDGATASDACGPLTITPSDGTVVTTGCGRSQTRTFTAEDHCGNTSTTSRTVTWIVDITPPVFTGNYGDVDLGCNAKSPAIETALGGATATDACSEPTITQGDGGVVSNGCNRSKTRTFTAEDHCGNTATISRTSRWIADETAPEFTGSYSSVELGCNPLSGAITGALGTATATDGCSTPTVYSFKDGDISTDGCLRSQTRTFFAKDGCENISTISRTVTWTHDLTKPTLTTGGTTNALGCNPSASDIEAALGTANATDACSTPTITQADDAVQSNGCGRSQTRTFTAKDGCGNTSTASRTVTWTFDLTGPTIVCPANVTTQPTNSGECTYKVSGGEFDATATDGCGGTPTRVWSVTNPNATTQTGSTTLANTYLSFGLNTIKWTATDVCGNTSTCSFTVDVNKITTTTTVTVTPNSQQYSDKVTLVATVTPYNCAGAGFIGGLVSTDEVTFKIGSYVIGTAPIASDGTATLANVALVEDQLYPDATTVPTDGPLKPGAKTVKACFSGIDPDYVVTDPTTPLTITKEDACGTYTGTYFINTNPTTTQATVHFEIIVKEDADGSLGDVRNSTVTFRLTDANTNAYITTLTALRSPSSTATQGVYYYDYVVTLNNALCKTFDVEWTIYNYYTNALCDDQETEVTVAAPANDFSAGGGYIILNNSQGSNAGDLGTKNNVGYNVKFNNSLTNLQGNFNTIIRRNGRTYQVKSNKPSFLKINVISPPNTLPIKRKAEITYINAVLKDVTDFVNGVCTVPSCWSEGGGTVLLTVEDNGEPGSIGASLDRIGFTVKNKNGVHWYSTNTYTPASNSTALQNLDGGNIQIRQGGTSGGGGGGISNNTVQTEVTTDIPQAIMPFDVKVFPNPSPHQFALYLENGNNEKVQITVYDALGRQVKIFEKPNGNMPIHFGADMKNGTYFVEVRQGDNRKTLKLIKQ